MKFGKFLEEEAIPEWRPKFIKYKLLKDKLQEMAVAIKHSHEHYATAKTSLWTSHMAQSKFMAGPLTTMSIPDPAQLKRASLFVVQDSEGIYRILIL
jgi:hypothetical protein